MSRRFAFHLLAAVATSAVFSGAAVAADPWPVKPVRWIVPFPPGSVGDVVARTLSEKLTQKWGQQVLVENKSGGATVIAAVEVMRAPPDGYTLLQGIDFTWTMNPYLFSKLPYEPLRDFTHITQLVGVPLLVAANEQTPVKSIAELVVMAKREPGKVSMGGTGPVIQAGIERFSREAGIKFTFVPYKGGADAFRGMMTGEIPFVYDGILSYLPHIATGKMRPLATTGTKRSPVLPNVPTLVELGYVNSEVRLWHALSAPAGLPADIQATILRDVREALERPDVKEKLGSLGIEPIGSDPAQFRREIVEQGAKASVIIKDLGLKLD